MSVQHESHDVAISQERYQNTKTQGEIPRGFVRAWTKGQGPNEELAALLISSSQQEMEAAIRALLLPGGGQSYAATMVTGLAEGASGGKIHPMGCCSHSKGVIVVLAEVTGTSSKPAPHFLLLAGQNVNATFKGDANTLQEFATLKIGPLLEPEK